MANLSKELLAKFEAEDYTLIFENDRLVTFKVPFWDGSGSVPKTKFNVLDIGLSRGAVRAAMFDDETSEQREIPEDILPLLSEVIAEKEWKRASEEETDGN